VARTSSDDPRSTSTSTRGTADIQTGMADSTEGAPSSPSRSRAVTGEPTHIGDARASQDKDGPRVRFSEDLNSAATAPIATDGGRGTPNLAIDTGSTIRDGFANHPVGRSPLDGGIASHISPTSPRTRDRGYSLRRTLFARGITTRVDNTTIELVEGGSSSYAVDEAGGESIRKHGQNQASITVSPIRESDLGVSRIGTSADLTASESNLGERKDRKTFGTLALPNYDLWARRQIRKNTKYQKFRALWKRVLEGKPIPPSKDGRHIDLDASRTDPLIDERTGKVYIGNTIRSSRYTLWNFLPRQLFFQFSKLANAYFLLISIMQMIPGWSTTGNYTTIIPLILFVAISMAKEGYDDVRRYKLDQAENNRTTLVLRPNPPSGRNNPASSGLSSKSNIMFGRGLIKGHQTIPSNDESFSVAVSDDEPSLWSPLKWCDVKVGDIIKLSRDDPVPADMVLLHSDGPNGIAYIETMALDGETNLKSKHAPSSLAKCCRSDAEIVACRAKIVVEDPNIDLYNFDGRVTVDGATLPLTTNEIVFRGSTLRNTTTAIGMVINSGEECKIRMNANKNPRTKAPAMQIITNKIVVMLVIFVVLLALFCTIAYQIWAGNTENKSWYLKDARVPFVQIIVGFIILFNTLIPLSLYVSLEIIKVFQLILMGDVEMYDPVSNTPMICNVSNPTLHPNAHRYSAHFRVLVCGSH
jgi:phospholipid-translocating ATPase